MFGMNDICWMNEWARITFFTTSPVAQRWRTKMFRTFSHASIALLVALLVAVPAGAPAASAQEAITLETIGAGRVMSPARILADANPATDR